MQKEGVLDIININKMQFEPQGYLVDLTLLQFNENLKTHIAKLKMIPMRVIQKKETRKTSAFPNFMPQLLPDGRKGNSSIWFINGSKIMQNMIGTQKHCFTTIKIKKNRSSFTWGNRNISYKFGGTTICSGLEILELNLK